MNADKLSVKMHAVEMILPKPGDVFFNEWTKSDKTKIVMHLKKFMPLSRSVDRLVLYIRS